jgi:hypothetical protein
MKRLIVPGSLTVMFLIVMILWEESLGIFQIPVLTLGCLSGFFLILRVIEMLGYRRPETLSNRQRKQEKFFIYLIVVLGGIGFLSQVILKILLIKAGGK